MRSRPVLYLFLAVILVVSSRGNLFAKGCFAGGCHQKLTKTKYMHGPVAAEMAGANGCKMCHVPSGRSCTVNKGGVFTVKSAGLCVTCHDKGTGSQHSAKEIESKCLNCHNPHGSGISSYMLRPGIK